MITHLEEAAIPPEISCRVTIQFLLYFQSRYGEERLNQAFARLKGPYSMGYLLEPRNFVSFQLATELLDILSEESQDPNFARRSGAFFSSPESLGFVYYMLRALGSPRIAYSKSVELGRTYNRAGEFHIEYLSDTNLRLRYQSSIPEPNRNLCEARMGQLASFPTIWSLPEALITERHCQVLGAESCLYELEWEKPSQSMLKIWLGMAAGAGALYFTTGDLLSSSLGAVAGGALAAAVNFHRRMRSQEQILARQADAMALSMNDLQTRVDEITQLNATLEQKVETRTKELRDTGEQLKLSLSRQLELDQLKTRFFQNVSHELRTPLTLILTPIDTVLYDSNLDPKHRKSLELVQRAAGRLLSLINSLLDLARLDGIQQRLALSPVDPAQLVRQLAESALPHAEERDIELEMRIPATLEAIPLDLDKIEKATLNLISNALKFTGRDNKKPAKVSIRVDRQDDELIISVSDTGIGIPESDLPYIFDRFHQVDGSEQRQASGTGIGLSLVKELIEFHCGTVEVDSVLGQGSTFRLRLPTSIDAYPEERLERRKEGFEALGESRSLEHQQTLSTLLVGSRKPLSLEWGPSEKAADSAKQKPRLLIADDNPDMLSFLNSVLSEEFEIRSALDGEEARDLAISWLPDLIISDVMMPKLGGAELVSSLRKHPMTQSIPVLLLTARVDSQSKIAGLEKGADDYLIKPFNLLELKARLRQLLRRREAAQKLEQRTEQLQQSNRRLIRSQADVYVEATQSLATILAAKDNHTHGHSHRVASLAVGIGQELGLPDSEIERLHMAAMLHDIGKMGMPERILKSREPLSAEDREIVQRHPGVGYQILSPISELRDVATAVLHHHEHFDGRGYPHRLSGTDIPLHSRIIAVADSYDAMTDDRPYRKKFSHAEALEELSRCSGTQFDPLCVDAFSSRFGDHPPVIPPVPESLSKLLRSPTKAKAELKAVK